MYSANMQRDLTDPNYFDFISFAQMATISREIPEGRQVFEVRPKFVAANQQRIIL